MKNLIVLVVLAALAYGGVRVYQNARKSYAEESVTKRMRSWLGAVQSGDEQTAMCQWAAGVAFLPSESMSALVDPYAQVQSELGLRPGIEWSLEGIDLTKTPPTATITLGSKKVKVAVVDGERLKIID